MQILDKSGLTYLWSKLKAQLALKQDKLTSGTTIKTVGGTTLLGSGDVPLPDVQFLSAPPTPPQTGYILWADKNNPV